MPTGDVILQGCLLTCNKFREQTIQATNIPRKRGGRKRKNVYERFRWLAEAC